MANESWESRVAKDWACWGKTNLCHDTHEEILCSFNQDWLSNDGTETSRATGSCFIVRTTQYQLRTTQSQLNFPLRSIHVNMLRCLIGRLFSQQTRPYLHAAPESTAPITFPPYADQHQIRCKCPVARCHTQFTREVQRQSILTDSDCFSPWMVVIVSQRFWVNQLNLEFHSVLKPLSLMLSRSWWMQSVNWVRNLPIATLYANAIELM